MTVPVRTRYASSGLGARFHGSRSQGPAKPVSTPGRDQDRHGLLGNVGLRGCGDVFWARFVAGTDGSSIHGAIRAQGRPWPGERRAVIGPGWAAVRRHGGPVFIAAIPVQCRGSRMRICRSVPWPHYRHAVMSIPVSRSIISSAVSGSRGSGAGWPSRARPMASFRVDSDWRAARNGAAG